MHALNRLNAIVRYGNLWRHPKLESTGIDACDRPYLLYVCRHPNASQDAISDALFVNKSSVARRLAHLEKEGYVTRTPDESDRRVLLVTPTEKALAMLPLLQALAQEWNAAITEGFTEEEIDTFSSLIARAYENAKRRAREVAE